MQGNFPRGKGYSGDDVLTFCNDSLPATHSHTLLPHHCCNCRSLLVTVVLSPIPGCPSLVLLLLPILIPIHIHIRVLVLFFFGAYTWLAFVLTQLIQLHRWEMCCDGRRRCEIHWMGWMRDPAAPAALALILFAIGALSVGRNSRRPASTL